MKRLKQELKPLTNNDLLKIIKEFNIKNFRGVFMKDTKTKINLHFNPLM